MYDVLVNSRGTVMNFLGRVVAESHQEAAASAAESVVDLLFGEGAVVGGVSDSRVGGQETAESGVGGVPQGSPSVD